MRLWAQIAVTVGLNLAALVGLTAGLVLQQTRSGIDSFLYAPARERVRDLGRQLEEDFGEMSAGERETWLATMQQRHGVTLAVFDDTGARIAGADVPLPDSVAREVRRGRRRDTEPEKQRLRRRNRGNTPMFLVKDGGYWIGYHFPVARDDGEPPVRHTLTVMAPSVFGTPFLFDWTPWLVGACLALLVTVACWLPLVRRFGRSVRALESASAEMARGHFEVAIPVTSRDEFGDLAASLRRMGSQLAQLVQGQRRFLADVAHELCAPLSRIQLSAGILEQQVLPGPAMARLERDVTHMSALVSDLLAFTKGAVRQPELTAVPVADVVREVIAHEGTGEVPIAVELPDELCVRADREYLQRALGNVVRNALRYAGAAGPIRVVGRRANGKVQVVVEDRGPGLPESDLEAIFDPFYKLDGARTPGQGGAGLGLAIVKSCVEACEGAVWCRNRQPAGLEVVMELNEAAVAAAHPGEADLTRR